MRRPLLVASIVAGALGIAAGTGATAWYLSGPMQRNSLARMQVEAASTVTVLEALRAGRTTMAQQLLEGHLDGTIVGLDAVARENTKLSAEALDTLSAIAKYRSSVSYAPPAASQRAGVPHILDAAKERKLSSSASAAPAAPK